MEEVEMKSMMILSLAVFTSLALTGCSNPFDYSIQLRYEVTGSAESADITYENMNGGISQLTGISLPWSTTISADPGDYVYLAALNNGETGSVTVTIYDDGKVFRRATSQGSHVTASVSGVLD